MEGHALRVPDAGGVAGDATWSVSTGLGACLAAAVYEVGRPARLSRDQADQVDNQWRTFGESARKPRQWRGLQGAVA